MYQGKFDAKSKGQRTPDQALDNILRERDEDNAARAARKASRDARRTGAPQKNLQSAPSRPAGGNVPRREPAPRPAPTQRPSRRQPEVDVMQPQRRGPRLGGIIFYTMYFLMIFVFFIGVFVALNWLNGWLKDYEAAQPTVKCQQVFDQLFGNPDWAQIYRLAGDPTGTGTNKYDTQFENVDSYVTYMEQKVAGQPLNYVETSAGLSGNKKYIVRLGTEKLATFTLNGHGEKITDIPDWQLNEVELFFQRNYSVTLCKQENHLAYINNYPISEDYTIQINSSKADAGIAPEYQVRSSIQRIDGLLTEPQLYVCDQTGASIEVRYNAVTGMYEEQIPSISMSDEEYEAVFGALEAYAGFMINVSGSRAAAAKYFDSECEAYKAMFNVEALGFVKDRGHSFENRKIHSYTKYSPTMFAVRASIDMHAMGQDNTTIDRNINQSMYFKYKNNKWVCTEMTNEDLTAPVGEVRLTFCDAAGNQLSTGFYATDAQSLTAPLVTAPAGKVFSGWSTVTVNEQGQKTWNLIFQPDEAGNVLLSPGYTLTPMVLYPLFTNA